MISHVCDIICIWHRCLYSPYTFITFSIFLLCSRVLLHSKMKRNMYRMLVYLYSQLSYWGTQHVNIFQIMLVDQNTFLYSCRTTLKISCHTSVYSVIFILSFFHENVLYKNAYVNYFHMRVHYHLRVHYHNTCTLP